MHKEKGKQKTC